MSGQPTSTLVTLDSPDGPYRVRISHIEAIGPPIDDSRGMLRVVFLTSGAVIQVTDAPDLFARVKWGTTPTARGRAK